MELVVVDAGCSSPRSDLAEPGLEYAVDSLYCVLNMDEDDVYWHGTHTLSKNPHPDTVYHISNGDPLAIENGFICLEASVAASAYLENPGHLARVDIHVGSTPKTPEALEIEAPSCIVRQIRVLEILDPASVALLLMDHPSE